MRSLRRFLAGATIALATLVLLAQCGEGGRGPERTVRRFFRALNDKDVNVMLSCFDPRQERMFRATFRLLEKTTGVPVHDILELLPGLHQSMGEEAPENFQFRKVRVVSRTITRPTARLTVSVLVTYRSRGVESTRVEEFEFLLEEFDRAGWRIVTVRGPTLRAAPRAS